MYKSHVTYSEMYRGLFGNQYSAEAPWSMSGTSCQLQEASVPAGPQLCLNINDCQLLLQ